MPKSDCREELQLLFDAAESFVEPALGHHCPWAKAMDRARAALAQPEPVADLAAKLLAESKPMDPEMAAVLTTEARWDLYEGSPTPQPEPVAPTDAEIMEVFWDHQNGLEELWADDWPAAARAVLARWGTPAINTSEEN
jgi:hypothetical protein